MVQIEYLNDGTLIRHYSDAGYMLLQVETGLKYTDPVDAVPCRYTYTETDERIEQDENLLIYNSKLLEKAAAYDILMGVAE